MLQELTSQLAIPGLPEWMGLVVLATLALAGLAYLLMPFSVFGVKGRLDSIEARLDEIQAEIRTLALRLPEPQRGRRAVVEEDWAEPVAAPRRADPAPVLRGSPPAPPPAAWPDRGAPRAEPRVDWPSDRR